MTASIFHRCLTAACLFLLCAAASDAGAQPNDPLAAPRAEFQQAYARLADAEVNENTDSASLRSYVLYPYLQAARLARELSTASINVPAPLDEKIAAFIKANEGQAVTQELRRTWLAGLADRAQWSRFLVFLRPASDELALRCYGFAARIKLGQETEGLKPEITQAWLTPRSLPECDFAFEWLRSSGEIGAELVIQRTRLALKEGNAAFARQLAQPLAPELAAPLLQWAALLENPKREIDALIASPQIAVEIPALLAGWTRLARADRSAAKQKFEVLMQVRNFNPRAASTFALALALPLSWDRDTESLMYFAQVDNADFDEVAREWYARAALWAGDWPLVANRIAALSEQSQKTARWRYWAARAAARMGDESKARELYESLLPDDNYYSAMAAARLKRKVTPNAQALPIDAAQIARVENLPAVVRARELRLSGLTREAYNEWRAAQQTLQASALPQAVHLAERWQWYDQAITTATAARVFYDYTLLYPQPYDAQVAAAAQATGLTPELIYGVLRQESLYRTDAISGANARGLMQLQIDTARRTARAAKQPVPTESSLADPAVNVMLGSLRVKELLNLFGGQLPVALAGYNAGPNAAQRWLASEPKEPDIWVENIPYNETRTYVQRILWHSVVFAWLRDGKAQDTEAWLADIRL